MLDSDKKRYIENKQIPFWIITKITNNLFFVILPTKRDNKNFIYNYDENFN